MPNKFFIVPFYSTLGISLAFRIHVSSGIKQFQGSRHRRSCEIPDLVRGEPRAVMNSRFLSPADDQRIWREIIPRKSSASEQTDNAIILRSFVTDFIDVIPMF